ncbi:DUF2158 domain-containing protein [Pseudomonas jessenii]|nr:DUF2158 domain-containing protein [Pseudomonas jessenii]
MPNQAAFKVGDIVKLKSGGPDMTVRYVENNNGTQPYLHCQWFAGKKLEDGSFPSNSLAAVEAKQ